jgi:hypothetical protein
MTKSEFIQKTMKDGQFVKNNATIISASPFRAVIRRKDAYEPNDGADYDDQMNSPKSEEMGDDQDEEVDQFERALNDFSQFGEGLGTFKDTYTTGRAQPERNGEAELFHQNTTPTQFLT